MYTQITSSESMHMKKWTDQTPKEEELKTNAVLGKVLGVFILDDAFAR
jgi:hypothetical protein